eukprot:m.134520 g.134520  ORF g.134520 m.134520 type:complete len:315 (+) comp14696_c0_seq2:70-1014(+)
MSLDNTDMELLFPFPTEGSTWWASVVDKPPVMQDNDDGENEEEHDIQEVYNSNTLPDKPWSLSSNCKRFIDVDKPTPPKMDTLLPSWSEDTKRKLFNSVGFESHCWQDRIQRVANRVRDRSVVEVGLALNVLEQESEIVGTYVNRIREECKVMEVSGSSDEGKSIEACKEEEKVFLSQEEPYDQHDRYGLIDGVALTQYSKKLLETEKQNGNMCALDLGEAGVLCDVTVTELRNALVEHLRDVIKDVLIFSSQRYEGRYVNKIDVDTALAFHFVKPWHVGSRTQIGAECHCANEVLPGWAPYLGRQQTQNSSEK